MSFYGTKENYDSAATTPVDERVIKEMLPYFYDRASNSSSFTEEGRKNKKIIDLAQAAIASTVNCGQEEVFFTSGGTEANNWVIRGFDLKGKSVVVSSTEHLSVLKTARLFSSIELGVNSTGVLDLNQLEDVLKSGKAGMVSIHWVNNETGTIQPIDKIHALCQTYGVPLHTDASQAYGKIPITFDAEFMTVSAHKVYGPKGVGALIIKEGVPLNPLLTGGSHQHGLRAGTLPVPLIVGFGKASKLLKESLDFQDKVKVGMASILNAFDNYGNIIINSDENRVSSFLNISLDVDSSEVIAMMEDRYGICLSKGAACMKGLPSYVLKAQGRSYTQANNAIRISLNKFNKVNKLIDFPHLLQSCISTIKEGEK